MSSLISVKEADFLDQDPPLRAQNYVCLSFVSPEDVIKGKDVFFFEEFMKGMSDDMSNFFDNLKIKYPDDEGTLNVIKERYSYLFDRESITEEYQSFVGKNSAVLESEYHKRIDFKTSIRGIKVRGVFDTLKEAEIRAQVLKKMDDKFNVYVAQVGCWCPWSPSPEDIENQEYAETHLNTMMKQYKDNQDKKDVFYQERKRDLQFNNLKAKIVEEDPWLATKEGPTVVPVESVVPVDDVAPVTTVDPVDVDATVPPSLSPPTYEEVVQEEITPVVQ